jgi:hypothetical protein
MLMYEFWDMRSHNQGDAFDTEHEAIESLREAIRLDGERIVEFLMLIEDDSESDNSRMVGMGLQLLDLVKRTA